MSTEQDPQALLAFVLGEAKKRGAVAADAVYVRGRSTEVRVRLDEVEQVKQSRGNGVGLRVFFGDRSASTSSSDLSQEALSELVSRICEAAQVTAEDSFSGLPDAALLEDAPAGGLDLYDASLEHLDVDRAIEMAREAESKARHGDPRIVNSEGAEMAWGTSETHLANSLGTFRSTRRGSVSLWTTPVAQHDGKMERDYWYTTARHLEDLDSPSFVGEEAQRRTLRRLGAKKPQTCKVPVVFEWTVASKLLGTLAGCVTGGAIYRKTSYLAGQLGEAIAHPSVHIVDDALVPRGAGSKDFDGEGLATNRTTIVEGGVLKSYLLDTYSAKKLGLATTRNASRGLAGSPHASATNFWMTPGEHSLEALIAGVERGLLVTETFGFGVNTITGDYSQGASGIWIENGELAYPVNEFTVASTLPQVWGSIDGIGSDIDRRRAVSAPSLRVAEMTIAGS